MSKTKNLRYLIIPLTYEWSSIHELIDDALQEFGLERILIEETKGQQYQLSAQHAIEQADIIIANITEGDPNIWYQIGFAHGYRKPVFLIFQKSDEGYLPSSLTGFIYFIYDSSKSEELKQNIQTWVTRYLHEKRIKEI